MLCLYLQFTVDYCCFHVLSVHIRAAGKLSYSPDISWSLFLLCWITIEIGTWAADSCRLLDWLYSKLIFFHSSLIGRCKNKHVISFNTRIYLPKIRLRSLMEKEKEKSIPKERVKKYRKCKYIGIFQLLLAKQPPFDPTVLISSQQMPY